MFGSRRGRPSLIGSAARTAGRTAVVVGTANAMTRPRGGPAPAAAAEPPAAPAEAPAAAAAGLSSDAIEKLKELAGLQAAGILTDAEFAEQKARILAG
jgi:hypothetical protein